MAYQALYRKYRPQRFDEVIGQRHVTETLAKEVIEGKVAHAYLFAGPRGTGKTTTARLLAKSLNCVDRGPDGEPCNVCHSCIAITETSSLDVIELDAASHNKVDDVREIRINVGTVAAGEGARRVYILDEAHMLSRAAGNALLKTLEEPPEHVIFVLATTEPYKLLDTIRSRAQRFDFHQVSSELLIDYLGEISKREAYRSDKDGLAQVVAHAGGSVRDAMSLLEQVAALGNGTVDATGVSRALGLADTAAFGAMVEAIAAQDAPAALGIVARLASQGADLRRFMADAVAFLRGVFLAQYAPNLEEVADEPPDTLAVWRRHADTISSPDLLRSIDLFGEALVHLRDGREERLVVELALLKATRPETALDPAAMTARIGQLERTVRELSKSQEPRTKNQEAPQTTSASPPQDLGSSEPASAASEEPQLLGSSEPASAASEEPQILSSSEPQNLSSSVPETALSLDGLLTAWPAIMARIRTDVGARRHAYLKEATPVEVMGSVAVFEVPGHHHFLLEQLKADTELHAILAAIAADVTGSSFTPSFRAAEAEPSLAPEPVRAPNKDELDEEGEGEDDPTRLVEDLLGGEVISD